MLAFKQQTVFRTHVSSSHRPVRRVQPFNRIHALPRHVHGRCASGRRTQLNSSNGRAEGPSTDLSIIYTRFLKLVGPYWTTSEVSGPARAKLIGVVALTLGTTGVSVWFNFMGRDFFNALSEKNVELFSVQLVKYLGSFIVGIPIFVLRDYFQSKLSLDWREWMTKDLIEEYLEKRSFYQIQLAGAIDNPDQRISADIRTFTDSALSLGVVTLNALVDLISFSGIMFGIYPPLFLALVVYSVGGTAFSLYLGKNLVTLSFSQEAKEADFRYNLVRVRENAESIAFYGGESSEEGLLLRNLKAAVTNYSALLLANRNVDFFTSFYRYLITLLPVAVVAPLYFKGEIEFGVITQSQSAFSHILNDVSLVVYQIQALAGFSAVVDRLGQFQEAASSKDLLLKSGEASSDGATAEEDSTADVGTITIQDVSPAAGSTLLELDGVTVMTPDGNMPLAQQLTLSVASGESILVMGPSGSGKTSLLRAIAGLWPRGSGVIRRYGRPVEAGLGGGDIMFVPQKPYMVLGSLREQLLYPVWAQAIGTFKLEQDRNGAKTGFFSKVLSTGAPSEEPSPSHTSAADGDASPSNNGTSYIRPIPSDADLEQVLRRVQLGGLLERCKQMDGPNRGLDAVADWPVMLSLGEQQRLAFARLLLAKPQLVLIDEGTSALDTDNEARMYKALADEGITLVSVGHRPTLRQYHQHVLLLSPADGESKPESSWQLLPSSQLVPVSS